MDEMQIVAAALRGEQGAFEELYHIAHPMMKATTMRIMRYDVDATEDILQNAWLKIHHKLYTFRGESKFRSWAVTVVTFEALMWMRVERHMHNAVRIDVPIEQHDGSDPVYFDKPVRDAILESVPLRMALETAYSLLTPYQLEAFTEFWINDKQAKEVASELKLHIGTVKSQVFKARKVLKKALAARA